MISPFWLVQYPAPLSVEESESTEPDSSRDIRTASEAVYDPLAIAYNCLAASIACDSPSV